MSDYEFSLPFPPSQNTMWATYKGRRIMSRKGREYRFKASGIMDSLGLAGKLLDCPLSVSMTLHPPTLRKYDVDNFCKALLDALTHCEFWKDDSQIVRLLIEKGEKIEGGKVNLIINRLAQ